MLIQLLRSCMGLSEFLNGDQITGKQAAIVFFAWLTIVIAVGVLMLLYTSNAV
ncbi:hypothetical protein C500_00287 [Natrialba magadii ATCC 43099]|nr:hypothetical protein C500_00287 [Natrialba magadii ATCC 43099]